VKVLVTTNEFGELGIYDTKVFMTSKLKFQSSDEEVGGRWQMTAATEAGEPVIDGSILCRTNRTISSNLLSMRWMVCATLHRCVHGGLNDNNVMIIIYKFL